MYEVTILTKEDTIRGNEPNVYKNIRTASFTTARILLTDDNNHMYTIRPGSVHLIGIREEASINEE